jgi:hypothetical protein
VVVVVLWETEAEMVLLQQSMLLPQSLASCLNSRQLTETRSCVNHILRFAEKAPWGLAAAEEQRAGHPLIASCLLSS